MPGGNTSGRKRNNPWYRILLYGLEYVGRYYSSYLGFVINNKDPENRNRLRIAVPAVNGSSITPTWAEPLGTWGGKDYGVQIIPRAGDMVWVSYSNGDSKHPIWQPGSFAIGEKPSEFEHEKVYGFKTPRGNIILINDQEDEDTTDSYIEIVHHNNGKITMAEASILLETDEFKATVKDIILNASDSIELGSNAIHSVVKGEATETHINNILNQLSLSTVIVAGAPVPLSNAAAFVALQSQTSNIKSSKVKTE